MCVPLLSCTTLLVHCNTRVCAHTRWLLLLNNISALIKSRAHLKSYYYQLSLIAWARAIRKRDKNSQFYKWFLSSHTLSSSVCMVVSSFPCVKARAKYLVLFNFFLLLNPLTKYATNCAGELLSGEFSSYSKTRRKCVFFEFWNDHKWLIVFTAIEN